MNSDSEREWQPMESDKSRVIVINGVRYHISVQLSSAWQYPDHWRSLLQNSGISTDAPGRSMPQPARTSENAASLLDNLEPWLKVEMNAIL